MSTPYHEAMRRLAESGDLAAETFYKVVAGMAVKSALEPLQQQGCDVRLNEITVIRPPEGKKGKASRPAHSSSNKINRSVRLEESTFSPPKAGKRPFTSTLIHNSAPSDAEADISHGLSSRLLEADDLDGQSDVSDYASTGLGTSALYSDSKSFPSYPRKDHHSSQRQSGRKLSGLDQAMRMMAYHMGRISFECECHFEDTPSSAMSKADKRHCRRFHKGLIGKKKAGEKRKAND